MRIDAHQHFWRYDPAEYPWINPDWPIRRDFLPPDLHPLLSAAGFDASIAVQARQTFEESKWLLHLADQHPFIAGVVGWVDLRSHSVEEQLDQLANHPKFVGVRHVVQDEPDDRFLLGAEFLDGVRKLQPFDLAYDLLVFPRQLPSAIQFVRKFSSQVFVLDHIAKPPIRQAQLDPWREQIGALAESPNVFCKLSGMITEADWTGWKTEDFHPYLDVVLEAFGADRVMFGSDWPVCLLAGSYSGALQVVTEYAREFSTTDQEQIFGGNAARCYGVPPGG